MAVMVEWGCPISGWSALLSIFIAAVLNATRSPCETSRRSWEQSSPSVWGKIYKKDTLLFLVFLLPRELFRHILLGFLTVNHLGWGTRHTQSGCTSIRQSTDDKLWQRGSITQLICFIEIRPNQVGFATICETRLSTWEGTFVVSKRSYYSWLIEVLNECLNWTEPRKRRDLSGWV